ncbi:MAG: twin-arginine translocase TatA/TatE family subunit [Candidatus Coatesbacteria bacterium]|nr:MAG: twin-arginine translocase TatA/TatE family subunit [Candidatus Coatesbacteria bacterium]RLC43333.1 MAG: twin-arginine translocase TatA/TatE family subunit [Candidatus Coatesbacteria bacterium]RLC44540.1 MAG: twin-arginine translocase TatA/TatE family subunit [Candidatus Coatesbacteria bacterium]
MSLGLGEILIIIIVIVLIFGVGFVTKFFGALGRGVREFKKEASGEEYKEEEEEEEKKEQPKNP